MSKIKTIKNTKYNNNVDPQKKFKTYWSANPLKMYSHIPRLYQWYHGKDIYPISIEIGLTSQCNHNCYWCSVKVKNIERYSNLSKDLLDKFIHDIKKMDVRSVVISGSGEQTLNPHFETFLKDLKKENINIGINTNGSHLTESTCQTIVENATWIRVSLDAATQGVRKSVHGVGDLHKAIQGLKTLVGLKKERQKQLSIGTQMVVCPENDKEIEACVQLSASLGVDYHQIKPVALYEKYYPNRGNVKKDMEKWLEKVRAVSTAFSRDGFQVIVRYDQFIEYIEDVKNKRAKAQILCLTSFSPYIEADGNVWYCVDKKGVEDFLLGNLNQKSLKAIWHSKRRKEVVDYLRQHPCFHICRNSPINEFLWEMKNPSPFYDFL
jgi:radical SAM protein with 4Fe4S-binding SPASM domain